MLLEIEKKKLFFKYPDVFKNFIKRKKKNLVKASLEKFFLHTQS